MRSIAVEAYPVAREGAFFQQPGGCSYGETESTFSSVRSSSPSASPSQKALSLAPVGWDRSISAKATTPKQPLVLPPCANATIRTPCSTDRSMPNGFDGSAAEWKRL